MHPSDTKDVGMKERDACYTKGREADLTPHLLTSLLRFLLHQGFFLESDPSSSPSLSVMCVLLLLSWLSCLPLYCHPLFPRDILSLFLSRYHLPKMSRDFLLQFRFLFLLLASYSQAVSSPNSSLMSREGDEKSFHAIGLILLLFCVILTKAFVKLSLCLHVFLTGCDSSTSMSLFRASQRQGWSSFLRLDVDVVILPWYCLWLYHLTLPCFPCPVIKSFAVDIRGDSVEVYLYCVHRVYLQHSLHY